MNTIKEQIGQALIELAQKYPGFPVALIWNGSAFQIGVIGLELEPDDWLFEPGPVTSAFRVSLAESTALGVESEKPQTAAARKSDPDRTRTYNQLIKSQLSSPARTKQKGQAE